MKRVILATTVALISMSPARATPPYNYYVMAGSFSVRANAVAHANRIGARMKFNNGLWRVCVGPFYEPNSAEIAMQELRTHGIYDAYVKEGC
jgi:cell division protein FtsN